MCGGGSGGGFGYALPAQARSRGGGDAHGRGLRSAPRSLRPPPVTEPGTEPEGWKRGGGGSGNWELIGVNWERDWG